MDAQSGDDASQNPLSGILALTDSGVRHVSMEKYGMRAAGYRPEKGKMLISSQILDGKIQADHHLIRVIVKKIIR